MRLSPEQLEELINELNGTSKSLAECLPTNVQEEELEEDQLEEINLRIFECSLCNWWFERGEESSKVGEGDEEYCVACGGE